MIRLLHISVETREWTMGNLSELNFSGCPNLEVLEVEQLAAQRLDLSSLTRLRKLNCSC